MSGSKLDESLIVAEALALLNEEGISGLSMRRLAARLGVRAPTLYWYFEDKTALLSAIMEALFDKCFDALPESESWQEWMRAFGRAIWRVQDQYPQSSMLIMSTNMDEVHFSHTTERVTKAVERFGMAEHDLLRLQSAVQALITGWSVFAHAQYTARIGALFDVEEAAFRSLDAMIDGWERDARP